ncbi:hypothetical protein SLS62_004153 [Diatrype stigma]|uniref:Uncharacterized protein n=1 Tax=Diatrype stigma TaxID=117547 RepID=A0AAN9V5B4_9PEZI
MSNRSFARSMVAPRRPMPSSLRTPALLIGIGIVLFICYATFNLNSRSLITVAATKFVALASTSSTTAAAAAAAVAAQQNQSIDVSSALTVSARQTGTSPPRITFGVTNNSTQPLTVLIWDTPLDPLALQLGHVVVSVSVSSSSSGAAAAGRRPQLELEPLDIPTIKIRRKMPPGADALVAIAAGATAENEVVLREALVPPEKLPRPGDAGKVAAVACAGSWAAVWPAARALDVTAEERRLLGAGERVLTGSYGSEPLEIKVGDEGEEGGTSWTELG